MEYSVPSVALLILLLFGVTTCSTLDFVEDPSLSTSESQNGTLAVVPVQPCVKIAEQVQQFRTDVLVVENNLTHCNMSTTQDQMLVREEWVVTQYTTWFLAGADNIFT